MIIKIFKFLLIDLLFLTSFYLGLHFAYAQISYPGVGSGAELTFSVSPVYPRANEIINVSVHGLSYEVPSSEIVWYLNGREVARGVGRNTITARTGEVGSMADVTVEMRTTSGELKKGSIVVRPAEVDLVWEADTTIPPFYKGKALFAEGSRARVLAIPRIADPYSGAIVPPGQLVYKWMQDGQALAVASGYGKSALILREISRSRGNALMSVEVSLPDGSVRAAGNAMIEPVRESEVLLYEADPLLGMRYEKAIINELVMPENQTETTLVAKPYYFDIDDAASGQLEYTWRLNGRAVVTGRGNDSSKITLSQSGQNGRASLEVSILNMVKFLQEAVRSTIVEFGKQ